ncbi:MAG: transketolase [Pirellulales bacterium]
MLHNDTVQLAKTIRIHAVKMVHRAYSSHIGCCLSIADILAVLYGEVLNVDPSNPEWEERDRFILSKGHAAAIYYAVLAECGFFPNSLLEDYYQDGSPLAGHATSYNVPGIECSTGSLGHGLPIGCGMALAAKSDQSPSRTFVVLGDGECNEGSIWEAASFAAHQKLEQLCVIVDCNKIQSLGSTEEVLNMDSLAGKWKAFGWNVIEINGHDHQELSKVLSLQPSPDARPTCVIAHTVKGKGVNYMENQLAWHYKSPNDDQLQDALTQLGEVA